jgi:DNA (cytosine-5)-methyltransferase 1
MAKQVKRKFISLFSGAMGLDLGLERAGFETSVCVENDPEAVATIRANRPKLSVIDKSIEEVSGKELRKLGGFSHNERIPLIAGGPPCQAFSVFGNRLGTKDTRGQLIFEFLRIVKELKPSTFIMENVRGLLSMSIIPRTKAFLDDPDIDPSLFEHGSLLKSILSKFNKIGYQVDCFVVNAVNYGAPQIRERLILVGNRFGHRACFPEPQYSNRHEDGLLTFVTLGDVIGPKSGFRDPCPEVMDFSPRKLKYLSMVPSGGNWRSLPENVQKESMGKSWYLKGGRSAYWRKLSFAFPSPTVVTMPNHAGTSMCHPTELRAITVGEAAAIQEFPLSWKFLGSTTAKFRQIGNAVPTRLGFVAGKAIGELLETISSKKMPTNKPSYSITHLRPHVRTRTFFKNGQTFAGDHSYYDEREYVDESQIALELA